MDQRSRPRGKYVAPKRGVPDVDGRASFDDGYDEDNDVWPSRMPNSVRRYRSDVRTEAGHAQADVQSLSQGDYRTPYASRSRKSAIPPRRSATQANIPAIQSGRRGAVDTEDVVPRRSRDLSVGEGPRVHWLLYVGLALLTMVIGWIIFTNVASWWQVTQDDWHYGRPRTFQIDAVVGHNDSASSPSHFIALNLRRHLEVIECPGGDCSKAKVYVGPVLIGVGQDLAPVTLSFKDVNGDGKPDMIITVQDSRFVFINDNGAFRSQRPNENVQL